MSKGKKTTTDSNYFNNQQQTGSFDTTNENEIGFADVPTANWEGYNLLKGFDPSQSIKADATIPFRFGAARNRAASAYGNIGGAYTNPELQAERRLSALGDIGQEEGAATASDAARVSQQLGDANFRKFSTLADMTRPVSFNKRSRQFGTSASQGSGSGASHGMQTQPGQSIFGSILSGIGGALPFI